MSAQTVKRDVLRAAIEAGIAQARAQAAMDGRALTEREVRALRRAGEEMTVVAVGTFLTGAGARCPVSQAFSTAPHWSSLPWAGWFAHGFDDAMHAAGCSGYAIEVTS